METNAQFKRVENEYTKKLENVIFKNQLPYPDITILPGNAAYLMAANLYLKLASQYPDHSQGLVDALIHSELTDTLIDTFSQFDYQDTLDILIYNTDDQTICYDTTSTVHDLNKEPDLEHTKIEFLTGTYYLYID